MYLNFILQMILEELRVITARSTENQLIETKRKTDGELFLLK